ncbi:SGNH/GDSL hydrolase family protein [Peribacillus kribbensis]|uniref:SGNH/GDSL hydrolase family protein n=1 Tax=Peribacillus kribbensis TaxID=356658 RepID=UPI0004003FBC|nr:SGNH/GDSL hydrolase family protein [Peribacillus kribbensis]
MITLKRPIQNAMIVVSSLLLLVWLGGFVYAVDANLRPAGKSQEDRRPSMADDSQREGKTRDIKMLAIGDSLTRGVGDNSGKGYIGYLSDQLKKKTDKQIVMQNLGISGLRSEGLLAQLQGASVKRELKEADYIFMTIGGNDLFQGGQTLENLDAASVRSLEQKYLKNLDSIFSYIRSASPDSMIFFVGLYNPFIEMADGGETSRIVREWNFKSAEAASKRKNLLFVPTFDIFEFKTNEYLYSDHFHPNAEGYRLIADRVASLVSL